MVIKIEALMIVASIVIKGRLCMGFLMEMGFKITMGLNKMMMVIKSIFEKRAVMKGMIMGL